MNSRGVTLVELIIYIVIAAIVVALMAVPFRKMVTSNKTERQESSLQTISRDALAVMSREIRNTGFKRYIVDASGTFNPSVIPRCVFIKRFFSLKKNACLFFNCYGRLKSNT